MRTRATWLAAVLVAFGLGLFTAGAVLAQTKTTIDLRNFEVLAVEGNRLVYRDQKGTHEITVPDDFRLKGRWQADGRERAEARNEGLGDCHDHDHDHACHRYRGSRGRGGEHDGNVYDDPGSRRCAAPLHPS